MLSSCSYFTDDKAVHMTCHMERKRPYTGIPLERFIHTSILLCIGRLNAQKYEVYNGFSHIHAFQTAMSEFGKDKMPASHQFLQIFPSVSEPDMFPEIVISIASISGSLKGFLFFCTMALPMCCT